MFTTFLSSLYVILSLITHGISINKSEYYLWQLDRAAYNGDVSKINKLVKLQLDWNQLYINKKSSLTAIHHALRGRHDSLASQSLQLLGNHEVHSMYNFIKILI